MTRARACHRRKSISPEHSGRGRLHGSAPRVCAALLLTSCLTFAGGAWAEGEPRKDGVPDPSIATSLPPWLGTSFGLRPALAAYGITYQLNYIGEVWTNRGGIANGRTYDGRLEIVLDADLEKLMGWKGASTHVNVFNIQGRGLSTEWIGNLMPVSNIEALRTTRLFEAWFEQKIGDDKASASVRVGQLAADSEFFISDYAGLFINGTFGWPAILADNLPSGGPAYPLATPGVRIKLDPSEHISLLAAMFNGDPAGPPGPGESDDPQVRDRYGLNFRLKDPPLLIGEVQLKHAALGLPGTVKLGAWAHFGKFDDLRFGDDGLLLADEDNSSGNPLRHRYNRGAYGIIDQQIYQLPGGGTDKGIGVFTRVSASPADRNQIDFYVDAGINFAGLVPYRPDDAFGVAFGYARISSNARAFDQDVVFFSGVPSPIRDYEAVIEVSYKAQIIPGWTIQPDFQYIWHPGGHIADPTDPAGIRPIKDAAVFGVRTTINY
jgi:porin